MITRRQLRELQELGMAPEMLDKVVLILSKPSPQTIRNQRYLNKHHGGKDPRCRTDSTPVPTVQENVPKNVPMGTIGVSSISRASLGKKQNSGCARKVVVTMPDGTLDEWSDQDIRDSFDEDVWPAFPKRAGSNPKKPAQLKYFRLIKSGTSPFAIYNGVLRFAGEIRRDGTEPQFVPQMVTWLNQERWNDEQGLPRGNGHANGHHNGTDVFRTSSGKVF